MKSSNKSTTSSNLYQPRVLLTIWQKRLFGKPTKTVYPLDAKEVFINEEEATDFFPIYINDLIKKGLLEHDLVFTSDNVICVTSGVDSVPSKPLILILCK